MANLWNEKFLNNQVNQLWQRHEDDITWQNKDLPDWDIFVDDSENIVINSLNQRFTNWTILDKSFSENNSKYVSFAGNYESGGFILFTTKVFDEVQIFTQIQTPANNRVENFTQIQTIEDYANDTFGQIFLVTKDPTGTRTIQIISNPFVTDEIDLGNLLSIKNLRLVNDSFSMVEWGSNPPTQAQWNDFCRLENTNYKIAVDDANDSYSESIVIICYRDNFGDQYGSARIVVFDYSWYDESALRITSQVFGYTTQDTFPALDVKTFNERSFITTNIAENGVTTYTTDIRADDNYANLFSPNTKYQLTDMIINLDPNDTQACLLWNDFQIFNVGLMRNTYTWAKAYYDWLKQYNGMEFLAISEDISFMMVLGYHVLRDDEDQLPYPNLEPYWSSDQILPSAGFAQYTWTGGPYNTESWYWYRGNINFFLDRDRKLDVNFRVVTQSEGGQNGPPGSAQWCQRMTAFLVRDFDTTIEREANSNMLGQSMFVDGNNIENISFKNGFTQNLFVKDEDGRIVTSTFTLTKEGAVVIDEKTLIHEVPYSLEFFNVPSFVNANELYMGYIQAQGYPQIDYLVWSYDEDGNVINKSPIRSINPINTESKSVFSYYLKNEVIYRVIDNEDNVYVGVIYLKDNDRITNIKQLNSNPRLFSYFKDDNSIQIRSLGDNNTWAELSYTSQDENTIYFREERNNQIDNFNLTRIGLLADQFLLSDNTITNKNMQQVSVYATLGQEVLNYIETNQINLFNNNNIAILTSDLQFKKNQWEEYLIGFQIAINTPNNWKKWFDDPDRMRITKIQINEVELDLVEGNFFQGGNLLKIGFHFVDTDEIRDWMYFGATGKIFKNKGEN